MGFRGEDDRMRTTRPGRLGERGVATVMVALLLIMFMGCVGLAIDLGRAYIIRVALATAVDGAALAAARQLPQGENAASAAATKIFNANFPPGFLGAGAVTNQVDFGTAADGSDLITITSRANMPTTFMKVAGFSSIDVGSSGQATRRLVDMAFVIDQSGSLGGQFPAVRTASSNFVKQFDTTFDRVALLSFSTNVILHDAIRTPARGFNLGTLQSDIGNLQLAGSTSTAEGLYQSWNQLRLIPVNNQSGLRVVVLFTDGAPNSWPGKFQKVAMGCGNGNGACAPNGSLMPYPPGVTGTLVTNDYPAPAGQNDPAVTGLYNTYNAANIVFVNPTNNPNGRWTSGNNNLKTTVNPGIPELPNPAVSLHAPLGGSSGLPLSFPLYDGTLPHQRPMIGTLPYPNHVQNANNAARNLMESVANAIRADNTGRAPIHIFALGLGADLNLGTGSDNETGSSMLQRASNDPASPDYNPNQPEGGYFFAGSTADLQAAFDAIRDRIIRISQ
jgi:Flp pilus assembly protein TadG